MHFVFPTIRNRNLKQWYAICFLRVGGGARGNKGVSVNVFWCWFACHGEVPCSVSLVKSFQLRHFIALIRNTKKLLYKKHSV